MFRWRCVAEGSKSGIGMGGAGDRAALLPVSIIRTPRLPPSANDNRPPRWLLWARALFLLTLAGVAVVWLRM